MFNEITFAFGVVEDINDPLHIGRLKIRIFNIHENLPVSDLEWYTGITPLNSASSDSIGQSLTGITVGSWVFGVFLDKELQHFIVLGSFWGKNDEISLTYGDVKDVLDNKFKNMFDFEEKIDYTKTVYPKNNVIKTLSGHIIEYDDSPGNERIHLMHKSGSYIEFMPNGNIQCHAVGDFKIGISGDCIGKINGDCIIDVGGKTTWTSNDEYTINAPEINHNEI